MDSEAAAEVASLRSWGLDASSVVIDLGCGTGQFALAVASECRRVVAVDDALHHLPDFWKVMALRQVRSMLRPVGIFRLWDVVYSFDPEDADQHLESWCAPASRWR